MAIDSRYPVDMETTSHLPVYILAILMAHSTDSLPVERKMHLDRLGGRSLVRLTARSMFGCDSIDENRWSSRGAVS